MVNSSVRRYNHLGAEIHHTGARVGEIMYDIAYIIALFESLPADAQQEILALAAQLAAEARSNDR